MPEILFPSKDNVCEMVVAFGLAVIKPTSPVSVQIFLQKLYIDYKTPDICLIQKTFPAFSVSGDGTHVVNHLENDTPLAYHCIVALNLSNARIL